MTLQRAQRLFAQVCTSLLAPLPTSSCDRSIPEATEGTRDAVEHCWGGGSVYEKISYMGGNCRKRKREELDAINRAVQRYLNSSCLNSKSTQHYMNIVV